MPSPTQGGVRVLRAATLASMMLGLACLAHLVGGGAMPGGQSLLLVGLVVSAESAVVTRRRLSPQSVLAVMAATQFLLHHVLMALTTARTGLCLSASTHVMASGVHGRVAPLMTAGSPGHGAVSPMMLGHVVAALCLSALLAYGEETLWRLWRWLAPRLLRAGLRGVALWTPRRVRFVQVLTSPGVHALLAGDPRRGPPVARCA